MDLTKEQLEDILLYHKFLYYNGKAIVSDREYDLLEAQLRKIAPDSKVLTEYNECPREFWPKYKKRFVRQIQLEDMLKRLDRLEKEI